MIASVIDHLKLYLLNWQERLPADVLDDKIKLVQESFLSDLGPTICSDATEQKVDDTTRAWRLGHFPDLIIKDTVDVHKDKDTVDVHKNNAQPDIPTAQDCWSTYSYLVSRRKSDVYCGPNDLPQVLFPASIARYIKLHGLTSKK